MADAAITKIRAERGLQARIAVACGISSAAVCKWRRVPAVRVLKVEEISGIPREVLRPDLYPATRRKPVTRRGSVCQAAT